MFRKGTRVVVINEVEARSFNALVTNGDEGTITGKYGNPGHVGFKKDNDLLFWMLPSSCLKRIKRRN